MTELPLCDAQTGPPTPLTLAYLSSFGSCYHTRRDVLHTRALLESSLSDFPRYLNVLALFLHGLCGRDDFDAMVQTQLVSDQLCALHNEFLRSILHNAHFSMVRPPNVTISKRSLPEPPAGVPSGFRVPERPWVLLTAADLRRLPTRREIVERLRRLPPPVVEEGAAALVCSAVRQFARMVLQSACGLQPRGLTARDRPRIHAEQLLFVCRHGGLDRVISPSVIIKYSLGHRPQKATEGA
jgi:hypothetical protein